MTCATEWAPTTLLLPHQQAAVDKLLPARVAALFMEMGTGKSRTAIEFAWLRRHKISRVLWLCPVSLKETVRAEIAKHTDCLAEAVYVFDEHTRAPAPPAWWYVIGIESMSSSSRAYLAAHGLVDRDTFVILDESSYIKGHRAKRTERITGMASIARYRMVLTGTPITQGVIDLYAQMRFLSPKILGYNSFYTFARNHLEYHPEYKGMIVASHNTQYLAAKMQPYTYQVQKSECLTLPDKLYSSRWYRMTPEQRALYDLAKQVILNEAPQDEDVSITIFRIFTALQQVTCGFWNRAPGWTLTAEHYRLQTLSDALEQIPPDAKVIVWTKYVRCLREIVALLGDDAAQLHGGLSLAQRECEVQRFRTSARYLVATPGTGGHGLTLNEAHYQVFYTNSFKYSERLQAEDRCHRIGQTLPVTYIDITCGGSIDERINAALARKENVVDAFRRDVERVKKGKRDALKRMAVEL
jgi:SNF2 family DNA or RNA helicase